MALLPHRDQSACSAVIIPGASLTIFFSFRKRFSTFDNFLQDLFDWSAPNDYLRLLVMSFDVFLNRKKIMMKTGNRCWKETGILDKSSKVIMSKILTCFAIWRTYHDPLGKDEKPQTLRSG
jgi:hypothetical protein